VSRLNLDGSDAAVRRISVRFRPGRAPAGLEHGFVYVAHSYHTDRTRSAALEPGEYLLFSCAVETWRVVLAPQLFQQLSHLLRVASNNAKITRRTRVESADLGVVFADLGLPAGCA
jgi:hypothetical protein